MIIYLFIVSTGITALKSGRSYIGIVESPEVAVAMRREMEEMTSTAVESDSDKE